MSLTKEILKAAETSVMEVMELYRDEITDVWVKQGHRLTGKSIQALEIKVDNNGKVIEGRLLVADHWEYQERGVKAEHVPFSLGSGRRRSKLIDALQDYFRQRGVPARETLSAAIATAKTWKREGMQTRASRRFSSTGRRKGFISEGADNKESEMIRLIEDKFSTLISVSLTKEFTRQIENSI